MAKDNYIWVCEGVTDVAAALTLGLEQVVGRPSCNTGADHLRAFLGRQKAVIVSDNDAPGLAGARKLAQELHGPTAIVVLPTKDLRDFTIAGGTKAMLESMVKSTVWRNH